MLIGGAIHFPCIWWINFVKHMYFLICDEFIELNWLCKHMKKVRSIQALISKISCTELSKGQIFSKNIRKCSFSRNRYLCTRLFATYLINISKRIATEPIATELSQIWWAIREKSFFYYQMSYRRSSGWKIFLCGSYFCENNNNNNNNNDNNDNNNNYYYLKMPLPHQCKSKLKLLIRNFSKIFWEYLILWSP